MESERTLLADYINVAKYKKILQVMSQVLQLCVFKHRN